MAKENYTLYTEVDPNNRFTVTTNNIDVVGLSRTEDAWVVDDKGVDHFDGDYEHLVDIEVLTGTSSNALAVPWGLSTEVNDFNDIANVNKTGLNGIYLQGGSGTFSFVMIEGLTGGSPAYDVSSGGSLDTPYYLTMVRDEAIGTFGTLYCYIYSDLSRTTLVDTLSLALREKKDFQYVYGADSWNTGGATEAFDGSFSNLDLHEIVPSGDGGFPFFFGAGHY